MLVPIPVLLRNSMSLVSTLEEPATLMDMDTRFDPSAKWHVTTLRSAVVVGCGGVGWWVAKILAQSVLCDYLVLVDGDTIEQTNRGRLDVAPIAVGENKAEYLAAVLRSTYPEHCPEILVFPWRVVDFKDFLQGCLAPTVTPSYHENIIISCVDDIAVHKAAYDGTMAYNYTAKQGEGFRFLRGSYDGASHITVSDVSPGYGLFGDAPTTNYESPPFGAAGMLTAIYTVCLALGIPTPSMCVDVKGRACEARLMSVRKDGCHE